MSREGASAARVSAGWSAGGGAGEKYFPPQRRPSARAVLTRSRIARLTAAASPRAGSAAGAANIIQTSRPRCSAPNSPILGPSPMRHPRAPTMLSMRPALVGPEGRADHYCRGRGRGPAVDIIKEGENRGNDDQRQERGGDEAADYRNGHGLPKIAGFAQTGRDRNHARHHRHSRHNNRSRALVPCFDDGL